MKSLSVTIQMKAPEQYFPVVLFVHCLRWFPLNLSLWVKSYCGAIQMNAILTSTFRWNCLDIVQGGSNFIVCGWNHRV